jgi:predicted PurR-regulated permease PerM
MNQLDSALMPRQASWVLAAVALLLVLHAGLIAGLYAGLLVYALVHLLAPKLARFIGSRSARVVAVATLSGSIVVLLSMGVWLIAAFFFSEAGSLPVLLKKLVDLIEEARGQIPNWLGALLPQSAEALQQWLTQWIRDHATQATQVGQQTARVFVQILIGMVIGAMAALYDTTQIPRFKPLAAALHERVATLHQSFRRVVFAQVRIAAINAAFTAIYLAVILPLAGIKLPLVKTMILVTFVAGLLPVIGNLISNSVIVMVSLSHSLGVAMASLLFLVTIHKLEYFLNARIIGTQINARAWELLAAMLVMEALFGIPGVIAAPVFYAYLKHELQAADLV